MYSYPYGPPFQPPPAPPRWLVTLLRVSAALVGVWIAAGTVVFAAFAWLIADAVAATVGDAVPSVVWAVVAILNAVAVALPAALVWIFARRYGAEVAGTLAAARAWTVAGAVTALLGTARAVPTPHNEALLAVTAVLAAAAAWVLGRTGLARGTASYGPGARAGLGLAAGLWVLMPWLWVGSLGGLTETVAALAAAAAFGWLAANLLDGLFAGFARSRWWRILVGGAAAGVALNPVAAALGGTGVNLAEMLVIPALGFAIAALSGPHGGGKPAVALLVGAAAFGPLAFVDPEETTILLGLSDIGLWTLIGSAFAVGAALAVATTYGLALPPGRATTRMVSVVAALAVTVAAAGVYGLAGRPGFYGEHLFVILADQADLTGLETVPDRTQRVDKVYRRLVEHAERTQAPLREELRRFGLDYQPYYLVNAILVDAGPAVRAWLSRRSDVDRVLLDQRIRPLPVATPTEKGSAPAPDGQPLWNIELIRADEAWRAAGARGGGITVGTSDSGVDGSHPALRDGFRGGDDSWYDPWNGSVRPVDHGGHGTHTMGSAVGRRGIGVAPDAQWVGCVNLDRNLGSPSRYLDCLQFMLAPFPRGGDPLRDGRPARAPHVLTNSWGCPEVEGCDGRAVAQAVAAFRAAGIFFVAAAGNSGPFCESVDDEPAPYREVFTVGAVNRLREVTQFSSRGPTPDGRTKPDVLAPGEDVLSSLPGGTYGSFDGTSMATPHVAGVVALMWSANSALIGDIDRTARILRETASPARPGEAASDNPNQCGPKENLTGAGLVDALAAVQAARPRG